ncbi:small secreted protein [Biscogniauxia mediterranea]|nr:small secreted protein [Biscogniauxia mediterranea]
MPVPFEALIPYGIILAMFGATGAGMSKFRNWQNGGKRARRSLDQWDRQMMDRDRRLTGSLRGQTDAAIAPLGFELNNPWRVEKRMS